MSCADAVYNPAKAGLCLDYVQGVAGLPHVGASAIDAWGIYAGARTSNPQPGDLVFFSQAASNQNYGHVGTYLGNNQFRSEWTDGNECTEDIDQFASENGVSVLGYVSVPTLTGQPASLAQTVTSSVAGITSNLGSLLPWILGGVALAFALPVVEDAL